MICSGIVLFIEEIAGFTEVGSSNSKKAKPLGKEVFGSFGILMKRIFPNFEKMLAKIK